MLLAIFVVSGLSLPHPDDSEYKIPSVGTGKRSQFYVLHSDGTFKYGFDSGDGIFEAVKSMSVGDRNGKFGYVDPDGKTIHLEYEAGKGGFVARGDHLPKPSAELAQAIAAVVRSSKPFIDPLASGDSDASYGFQFHSEDHSRDEKSDADGTVTGSYSYVDENGVKRSFTYRAGKGIGFVIEGDGLTQDVSAPIHPPIFRQSSPSRSRISQTQTTSTRRVQTPSRPFGAAFRASTSYGGREANIAQTRSQTPGDASYSFSFDAGDHSRSETSDSKLNVDGKFSFVADDGNRRTLNYVAGRDTGFQAEGAHLPKAPEPTVSTTGSSPSFRQTKTKFAQTQTKRVKTGGQSSHFRTGTTLGLTSSKPSTKHTSAISRKQFHPTVTHVQTPQRVSGASLSRQSSFSPATRSFEEANIRSSVTPSGPYSFSYKTSSHSRTESGDEDNDVVGEFEFVAEDDGQRRKLNYEAGSSTGFIAQGAHIPIGPEVPGAPSGQPTGRLVRLRSQPFVDPLADSDTDASYKFEFDSDTYSRSESADEDGNIQGTYTVVEDDGTRITYRFKAGKGIGFETKEISRSVGPAPVRPTPYSGPLAGTLTHTTATRASGLGSTIRLGGARGTSRGAQTRTSKFGTTTQTKTSQASRTQTLGSRSKVGATARKTKVATTSTAAKTPSFSQTRKVFPSTQTRKTVSHSSSFTPSAILKSSQKPSHSELIFPGFTLNSYKASPNAEKFGYVLRFD